MVRNCQFFHSCVEREGKRMNEAESMMCESVDGNQVPYDSNNEVCGEYKRLYKRSYNSDPWKSRM